MAFGDPSPVDFNYFLARKYAQLQQQADATTSNAASTAIQATAQAGALGAAARVDNTRADLMPDESRAQIGLQRSQANLNNNQAAVVIPESTARIGQIGAETANIGINSRATAMRLVSPRDGQFIGGETAKNTLNQLLGPSGYQGFQLSTPIVARDIGF